MKGSPEVPGLLDEDLIEVRIEVFDLVQEISCVKLGQRQLGPILQHFKLMFQGSLTLGDDVIKVLQLLFDVLKVNAVHFLFELLDLLVDELLDLSQTALYLEEDHVVAKVGLHIGVFA